MSAVESLETRALLTTVPFTEGFEALNLATFSDWTFATTVDGVVELDAESDPHAGAQSLRFANITSSFTASTASATLELDLSSVAGATDLALDFRARRTGIPAGSNVMRVLVSDDETNWKFIASSLGGDYTTWVNHAYDLDEILTSNGIAVDGTIYVRFLHFSNDLADHFSLDDIRIAQRDPFGPRVISVTPDTPTPAPLSAINVTFDKLIYPGTFTAEDVTVTSPVGEVIPLNGDPVDSGDQQTFNLPLATPQQLGGAYTVVVGPDITDIRGNPMNQNGNNANAEPSGDASYHKVPVSFIPTTDFPYVQTFDSVDELGNHWMFNTTSGGRIQLVHDNGRNVLRMDHIHVTSTDEAILSIDLAEQSNVRLGFQELNHHDEAHSGEGVYISDDHGANWFKAASFMETSNSWQTHDIDLDAQLAAAGMTYTSSFWIKLQQYDNGDWPLDGRQIDDFSVSYGALNVSVDSAAVVEGTTETPMVTVSRPAYSDLTIPLDLSLSIDNLSEASIQSTAQIPTNETSVTVPLTILDDALPDGVQTVAITASGPGFPNGIGTLTVDDNDPLGLTLTIDDTTVNENDGPAATTATVHRNGDLSVPLVVELISSNEGAIELAPSVTIPAGQTSVTFNVGTHNDYHVDGVQSSIVTVMAADHIDASVQVEVENDDTLNHRTIGGRHSGNLPEDTYTVTFDVQVPTGETLTVAPRTQLLFDSGTTLTVRGILIADATAGSEIVFTSSAATPTPGDWNGVAIASFNQPTSILNFVEIAYGFNGIELTSGGIELSVSNANIHHSESVGFRASMSPGQYTDISDITLADSRLHHNQLGVYVAAFSNGCTGARSGMSITGNDIHNNSAYGIRASAGSSAGCIVINGVLPSSSASPPISGNTIRNNAVGIRISASRSSVSGSPSAFVASRVTNNLIVANSSHGIVVTGSSAAYIEPVIINNTIANNGGAGIRHTNWVDDSTSNSVPFLQNNTITGNLNGIEAEFDYTAAAGQVSHNNIFGNSGEDWVNYVSDHGQFPNQNSNGTPADFDSNISVDPFFVSPTDWHLQPSSPLVNAGSNASSAVPPTDIDGQTRSGQPDIGFDEGLSLDFSIDVDSIVESDGNNAAMATISRGNLVDTSTAIVITINVDDDSEVTVPQTITLESGQASLQFPIHAVDDILLDGPQTARVLISAAGLPTISDTVDVLDDESLTVSFVPGSIVENAGSAAAIGTVFRSNTADLSSPVMVALDNGDDSEISIPASVIIEPGHVSATFSVDALDDDLFDGIQTVTVTASGSGFNDGSATIDVTDHEPLLLLIGPDSFSEGDPVDVATATVSLPMANLAAPLTVRLSSPTNELSFPATVEIPMGQDSVSFNIGPLDDLRLDGTQVGILSAAADGYVSADDSVEVLDNDVAGLVLVESDDDTVVSESMTTDRFSIRLTTEPLSGVRVKITPEDSSEVTVDRSAIVFHSANWNTPQFITVTGVDDGIADGHQTTLIRVSVDANSSNAGFRNVPDQTVSVLTTEVERPDLVATNFNAISAHIPSGTTDVEFTVLNDAAVNSGTFQTHVVWSPDQSFNDDNNIIVSNSTVVFSGLGAGATETRTIPLQLDRAALLATANQADKPGQQPGTMSQDLSHLFLVVDTANAVAESNELNNAAQGTGVDSDHITYFPWDSDGNGTVTPMEALEAIRSIGQAAPASDFDGNGIVTPLEAISVLQRLGYVRNESAFAPQHLQPLDEGAEVDPPTQNAISDAPEFSAVLVVFNRNADSDEENLFAVPQSDDGTQPTDLNSAGDVKAIDEEFTSTTDWLSII